MDPNEIVKLLNQHLGGNNIVVASHALPKIMTLWRELNRQMSSGAPMPEEWKKLQCLECGGRGSYYTEWNDAAEKANTCKVLHRPDPPDGTVAIECPVCHGTGTS